jgi:methionyl-tRNA formyltransferase
MRTGIVSNSTVCLPLLNYLHAAGEDVIVFSAELPVNDKGAIASFCAAAGIPCTSHPEDRSDGHEKSSGQSLYDWVHKQRPDIVFVIGYNEIIRISRFTTAMPDLYNVHFGHLPEYRGPNPVFWQLKKGAPTLAITIHRVNKHLDAGAVAWKKEYPNEPFFSYGYVHQLMSHYLLEGVHALLQLKKQGHPIYLTDQDERRASYYERPGSKDVCICWKTMSATAICDLIKACNPWNSGAVTIFNGFEIRISDAESVSIDENATCAPGTILDTSGSFLVSCINKEALHIHTLTVNGILMPGRFAANYGFLKGQTFTNG